MTNRSRNFGKRRPIAGMTRRGLSLAIVACVSAAFAASVTADELVQAGTVRIEQVQIAFIGSGNLGGGTLLAGGKEYDFTVGGLGVGGIGVSKMTATGAVYNLRNLNDFAGAYVQGRYGLAIGNLSAGELVLQNTKGVVLRLRAERTGLALSLGGDAVYIDFD